MEFTDIANVKNVLWLYNSYINDSDGRLLYAQKNDEYKNVPIGELTTSPEKVKTQNWRFHQRWQNENYVVCVYSVEISTLEIDKIEILKNTVKTIAKNKKNDDENDDENDIIPFLDYYKKIFIIEKESFKTIYESKWLKGVKNNNGTVRILINSKTMEGLCIILHETIPLVVVDGLIPVYEFTKFQILDILDSDILQYNYEIKGDYIIFEEFGEIFNIKTLQFTRKLLETKKHVSIYKKNKFVIGNKISDLICEKCNDIFEQKHILIPCGCLRYCYECAVNMSICENCKSPIDNLIKLKL